MDVLDSVTAYDRKVRYVWIAIIGVSGLPVVILGAYFSPWLILLVGVDGWIERLSTLRRYRWWLLFSLAVCAFASVVYVTHFG